MKIWDTLHVMQKELRLKDMMDVKDNSRQDTTGQPSIQ